MLLMPNNFTGCIENKGCLRYSLQIIMAASLGCLFPKSCQFYPKGALFLMMLIFPPWKKFVWTSGVKEKTIEAISFFLFEVIFSLLVPSALRFLDEDHLSLARSLNGSFAMKGWK